MGLVAFWRTLHAFLVRDLVAQFGRHNIGFLWVIVEPLVLCAGVAGIWYLIKPEYMHGVQVLAFVITGYMPLTLFRHLTGPFARIFRRASPLMVHRQLDMFDIFLSRATVELAGSTTAFIVIYCILFFSGLVESMVDWKLVLSGWLLLALFGLGVASCIAAASELSEAVAHFISPLQYLTVPLTPTFYMVDWLPQIGQDILYYNPMSHPYEMIRAGFFGDAVVVHYQPEVTMLWSIAMLAFGLFGIEAVRDRLHNA